MKKKVLISVAAALVLLGAGCSASVGNPTAAVPAAAPAPAAQQPAADGFLSAIRAKFAMANIAYTEKSEMDDVAKMATKDSIVDANKFKADGVSVLVVHVKDAASATAVKAEIEAQYKTLMSISSSARVAWLEGDATHLVVANYKVDSEAAAQKVLTALGGSTAVAPAPAAAAEVTTKFKVGDKVEARWKGGSYYKGTIAAVNADGTYNINYDDGDKESNVKEMNIKLQATAAAEAPVGGTKFKVGDKVLANWKSGSRWWEAKVTGIDGPAISVKYDSDSTTDSLGPLSVAHYPSGAATVKVGDKVVAKWTDGKYYGGKVTALKGTKATVAWSDNSGSMDVALTDIAVAGK